MTLTKMIAEAGRKMDKLVEDVESRGFDTFDDLRDAYDRQRNALKEILDELGIPGKDYPMPITNAVEIARNALEAG